MPYVISCFQRVQLKRDYRIIVQTAPSADVCSDLRFAIIRVLFELNNRAGNTEEEIYDTVVSICPDTTYTDFTDAFRYAKQKSLIAPVTPSVINWLVGPVPLKRYVLSSQMDNLQTNSKYVLFMIRLVGGFQSNTFNYWFEPYCAPIAPTFNIFGGPVTIA